MAELNLPNIREGGNIRFRIGLEDGGVAVDWSGLEDIRVFLYADAQKQVSGEMCEVAVDEEDNTVLKCKYSGDDVQYRGINSVLVRAKYLGEIKVYDKPAINIVARTSDATGVVEIDDPVVPVQISVEEVSTSLLNNAIDAAINAAAEAEKAAHLVPLQVLEDCVEATGKALEAASKAPYIDETTGNWFVWDAEAGEYVDSGKTARGATGNGIASWSVVESSEDAGNNVVTVTFTDGTSESFNVKNGHTGNGIASIVQTVESPDDAGTNVITITMTNGTVVTFNVKNGSKGTPGVAQAAYKSVSSLPTASAQTMDKIYLTPSGTSGVYNMSYTEFDGSAYSWQDLGTTAIQLSDYATKAELDQLEAKVDDLFADSPADLDIADEDGNVVARFEGGNIKVKNFDSSETTKTANGAAGDLDICDESGNIVARFKDGNIKTKNFDSSRFQQADDICDFIENSFHTGRFKFDRVTIWDYYAAYDELCDFRQILVKESPIGFSTLPSEDRATKDPNQYPINLYRIPNTSARKRIVLMGAIHGDSQFTDANPTGEDWYGDHGDAQENILAPYYFVCDLIRHKDDNPEYKLLLQEYEIDIIPILNPWGVQNHSRRNGNNVDLNRNFDATDSQGNSRWQNQTQGNKGASPFSENETQAIVSYINAHNDIHLVVECHARGEVNLGGDNRFYAVCPDGVPCQQGITDAVNAAKAKFGAQGGLHPYTRDEVPATCYAWIFFEKGIPTFEPELGQSIGRRFFFNVKMSTAKRLNINDVYTITTTVPDYVVTFRVVASDGSDEAMVLGDTYALLYNGTYRCGNDTITIASNTVMDAPSRHCKELLYSMFWYYRKLVFNTL